MEGINYNDDPVYFCQDCLSLNIQSVPTLEDSDYCEVCGSNNIGQCHIDKWEELFQQKYGYKYLEGYGRDKEQEKFKNPYFC